MEIVAIDLGYGSVKVAMADGRRMAFPARFAPAREADSGWGLGHDSHPLSVNGNLVVVGAAAAGLPGVREPIGDARLGDPDSMPLLAAALWDAHVEGDVVLASGLPLGAFSTEAEPARRALHARTLRLARGRVQRQVRIGRVLLRPQGVGAALHLYSTGRLQRGPGWAAVVDIGARTTDALVVDRETMRPVRELSLSLDRGLAQAIAEMAGGGGIYPLPIDLAERALRDPVQWHGRTVGGPDEAAPILQALAGQIGDVLAHRWGGEIGRMVQTVLVGGGGALLAPHMGTLFPVPPTAVPVRDAIYANASGYLLSAQGGR